MDRGGMDAITGPSEYGGMGLPVLLNTACIEIWSAANLAFSLCPLLTLAAIEAVQSHASEALKAVYLAKLVGRMDRHHEFDRAAGGLRPRRAQN